MKYYNVKEIADMEDTSVWSVYRLISNGFLVSRKQPTKNNHGRLQISEEDYENYKKIFKNAWEK